MPTEISQLRPEGMSAAVEFAASVGCQLEPAAVDPQISLLAKDGDTVTAVILGVRSPGGACELHVCLGQADDPGQLTGELLNKALMKVHGAGARRCQISHHGNETQPADWPSPLWTGEQYPAAAAQAAPLPDSQADARDAKAPAADTPTQATPDDQPETTPAATPDAEAA